ncbi:hypothetical protein [Jiella pacifica]|nr:hypothetical protein [Jiella pacifica]
MREPLWMVSERGPFSLPLERTRPPEEQPMPSAAAWKIATTY